ncbi:4-carboxy-4-hydroxy-2-oxoadipate aldolase/oxaloacetate decarboxylase [Glaciihabitans sp. UYNi722]|uniref:4-carboxy-4-hydroxy-2-oxoadipate aldolase/oxaloacetate decarboxylase n=1 Tax=Glaciihabitans sp. UYNi722 TaxID=3156344 RepID=UPI00339936FF
MAIGHVAYRTIQRADAMTIERLGTHGVATVHEAQKRTGLLSAGLRPISSGLSLVGSAVTVSVPPADNWMIHVGLELCEPGDVLVVAPTSPSEAGYFGDLLATSAMARGIRGLVIDAGCRDIVQLNEMGFPVWSRHISALGTVKETLGTVNVPVVCGGALVRPGDVIVADDDGVVAVPRDLAGEVLQAAEARDAREALSRKRYRDGEASLDILGLRGRLEAAGLVYLDGPAP